MNQLSEEPFWYETFQAQVANLPAGAHLCQIYRTADEQLDCALTFCSGGIRRNQQCLYIASPQRGRELLRSMQASGQVVNTIRGRFELVDVGNAGAVEALIRDTAAREGRLDVLVSNAFTTVVGPLDSLDVEA